MKKKLLIGFLFLQIILIKQVSSQVFFEENFNYTAGDSIGAHGWTWNTGTTNNALVVSPGLTYPTYPLSGIGNACRIANNGYDYYKPFTDSVTSGTVYAAFMVRIDSAKTTGDYFFALLPPTSTTFYSGRVYVKDSVGLLAFGLSKFSTSQGPLSYTLPIYAYNTTYLMVLKYKFNPGALDDTVSLYVFSGAIPPVEPPVPTVGPMGNTTGNDPTALGRVALRQGSASSSPTLNIDGIRVANTWGNITSVQNVSTEVPANYSLKQNYPNPFNPSTKIEFALPNSSYVTLDVYDALGRKVANLVNEKLNSGTFSYNFNANGLTSGVYFYKLSATETASGRNFIDTKSMVLVK